MNGYRERGNAGPRLMAHLVSGYPDSSGCRAVAEGLIAGGADYLEIQIPFGDPSADGPAIQTACAAALAGGHRSADAFALAAGLRAAHPEVPVFIMSYASLVVTPGVGAFAAAAASAGVAGLIVPDLPFDCDEGLAAACAAAGVQTVPVAAPTMRPLRLASLAALGRPYVYAALRAGITGARTSVDGATEDFLSAAAAGGSSILAGFGVRSAEQVTALGDRVHAVVAGSVFVDTAAAVLASAERAGLAREDRDETLRRALQGKAEELLASRRRA